MKIKESEDQEQIIIPPAETESIEQEDDQNINDSSHQIVKEDTLPIVQSIIDDACRNDMTVEQLSEILSTRLSDTSSYSGTTPEMIRIYMLLNMSILVIIVDDPGNTDHVTVLSMLGERRIRRQELSYLMKGSAGSAWSQAVASDYILTVMQTVKFLL